VEARVLGRRRETEAAEEAFREPRGAFVTLVRREDGELRGCIGYAEAVHPLWEAVVRGAEAAATEDDRFEPVAPGELGAIRLELSILSPLGAVRPEDVRVGEDGLVVRRGQNRGLLLPQVAVEWGFDRETFLAHTCRKAGLGPDAWKEPGTEILAFQAEVFGED
jgi:AmmeMemoRadiSam system protein A